MGDCFEKSPSIAFASTECFFNVIDAPMFEFIFLEGIKATNYILGCSLHTFLFGNLLNFRVSHNV